MIERDISMLGAHEFLADEVLELVSNHETETATVIALHGDLGAGKTTFVQAFAKKLGVFEQVTSPTFVLMKGYDLDNQAFNKLYHADVYRIEEIDEMRVIGFEKLLQEKGSIIVIEWAEKVADMLPADIFTMQFSITGEKRSVQVIPPVVETDNGKEE